MQISPIPKHDCQIGLIPIKKQSLANGEILWERVQRRPGGSTFGSREVPEHMDLLNRFLRHHLVTSLHLATLQSIQVICSYSSTASCYLFNSAWIAFGMITRCYSSNTIGRKKALQKKQKYKFSWNENWSRAARDSYYFNWPVYFP
ncbi:hypothetical protein L1987_10107 [Smallanthus sonchifolius]|uniref:Uncharacterized protein n=1 Tax=Smallanthus sonchifolius TaxID=185202 RepID=A0ACB9JR66_9ASTR|nr:hypothetical protein L1987_10107 [Smallanthus sonchifolius]